MTRVDGKTSRRAFLGLAAAGVAGTASACSNLARTGAGAGRQVAATAKPWRTRAVAENSLPGTSGWKIRHLGAEHEIEGYTGKASVLAGESFPLFASTTSSSFHVTAYRLGWYQGYGAREVWRSGKTRGGAQRAATVAASTNTVTTDWDPALEVPTHDWPAGAYLLKLDAESGAQRYVPITVRSPSCAGKVVLKACVQTWQAYNMWGGYDLYKDAAGAYANRSLVVSLDRPYDSHGADMFLTYERNVVKLAEYLAAEHGGIDLAYVTSMDIAADPRLLGGARQVVCYKTDYTQDPMYGRDDAQVTSDWREPPAADPESSLIGTIYEGYPADAALVVSSPKSWIFKGTGVAAGDSFPHLVGIEYDRVDPAYPVQRPIEVLSHSPLTCQGKASFGDSAYYTHSGGAGVFNSGTMRWVEAIYGDQPHGIGGQTPGFVRQSTTNILRAFADGPAAAKYPANDNLDAIHEYNGDPVGNPQNLQ